MMEVVSSSEMSVNIYQIPLCYITEDSHFQIEGHLHPVNTWTNKEQETINKEMS
jgi:hypothetical protein